jgi:3-hydroxyacyl-CoA dehydrogenase/enoyl-CoA hydratase/3-hydroxybutyryl-CoA epimerase
MAFQYSKDARGIVTLTLDMPGRSANVINEAFGEGLSQVLDRLDQEKAEVTGIILASGKETFLAGADIDFIFPITDPMVVFGMAEALKTGFRKLETLGIPVVAAINGAALGGGFEFALAAHYRIALDHPKVKIGLPEVSIGVIPGGGGIARVVRMLGLQAAFPILTEGTRFDAKRAKENGLIDALAPDMEDMMAQARAWILANPESVQPWDKRGYRMPGGGPTNPRVAQMLAIAPAIMKKKTRGNYPNVLAILNAAVEGAQVDFDTASRIESRYFASAVVSPEAKNMIKAFWYQLNEINRGQNRPEGFPQNKVQKLGMLGAGMMGAGIAHVSAAAGIEVVLKDVSTERAEAGKAYSDNLLSRRLSKGAIDSEKKAAILGRIHPTGDAAGLKDCDLVIEAVFENRELKAKVTREAEVQIPENAVFASNTSTLPITGLAEASLRPDKFIGLHFFSPVDKMQLVEIIVGKQTSDETLAKAFDYVKQIRKTPIVVNDSRGFYTSRVFATYVLEGAALLGEGQNAREIEVAGMQAGMPVGPLALLDEVSIKLVWDIRVQTRKDFEAAGIPYPMHPSYPVLQQMAEDFDRKGKAAGAGFYEYPEGGKKFLWPELRKHYPLKGSHLSIPEMIERMMFIQCIESARCLEEGVVRSVADANIGSIFGWGFAPFKGGTLQYISDYGLPAFLERSRILAGKYGDRFQPPALLAEMTAKGEVF